MGKKYVEKALKTADLDEARKLRDAEDRRLKLEWSKLRRFSSLSSLTVVDRMMLEAGVKAGGRKGQKGAQRVELKAPRFNGPRRLLRVCPVSGNLVVSHASTI